MAQPYVMIVDDDFPLADLHRQTLQKVGIQAEVVGSVSEAKHYLARIQPDVIVLDIDLPDGTGDQVMEYIHNHVRLAETQIIVTTGLTHFALPWNGRVYSILFKPISAIQLRNLVTRLCRSEASPQYVH